MSDGVRASGTGSYMRRSVSALSMSTPAEVKGRGQSFRVLCTTAQTASHYSEGIWPLSCRLDLVAIS